MVFCGFFNRVTLAVYQNVISYAVRLFQSFDDLILMLMEHLCA
jgi:hypothetical protein